MFGLIYGISITIPVKALQLYVTFPLVALSRQLVYSIVFHCIAELFGFLHFGQILGIINLAVGLLGCLQYPIVSLAEGVNSFSICDYILGLLSLPLFAAPFFVIFRQQKRKATGKTATDGGVPNDSTVSNPIFSQSAIRDSSTMEFFPRSQRKVETSVTTEDVA